MPLRRRRTAPESKATKQEPSREQESEPEPTEREPSREPESEPSRERESERKSAPVWQRKLTPLQIVGALAGIVGLAVLLEAQVPTVPQSTEEPASHRALRYRERHRLADRFARSGTESCVALGEALRRPLVCPDPASELRLLEELEGMMDQPDFSAGMCSLLLAEVDIMRLMLRCVRP